MGDAIELSGNGVYTQRMTDIRFFPANDQVLVLLDVKQRSFLERRTLDGSDKPKLLPSGVVQAVGRGVYVAGHGFVEPQVKVGDHVALATQGTWYPLPLSSDPNKVYVTLSETDILGCLEGADENSSWYAAADDVSTTVKGR